MTQRKNKESGRERLYLLTKSQPDHIPPRKQTVQLSSPAVKRIYERGIEVGGTARRQMSCVLGSIARSKCQQEAEQGVEKHSKRTDRVSPDLSMSIL